MALYGAAPSSYVILRIAKRPESGHKNTPMKTSNLQLLRNPTVIVLAGGHGANDPGAENGPHKERDQAIKIVDLMAAQIRSRGNPGVTVEIAPHEHDTEDSIRWVNSRYGIGDA